MPNSVVITFSDRRRSVQWSRRVQTTPARPETSVHVLGGVHQCEFRLPKFVAVLALRVRLLYRFHRGLDWPRERRRCL